MKAKGFAISLWVYSCLLFLPAILLIAAGAWYVWDFDVPAKVRNESHRISLEYRDLAEEFLEHPELGQAVAERPKGGRKVGAINKLPWGYVTEGDETLVWWRCDDQKWLVRRVETIRPINYVALYYYGGVALALVLLGLSGVAVFFLRRSFRLREQTMREREDFLRAAIHDLKTPVVGMNAMLDVKALDLAESRTLAKRLDLIVQNLQDFMLQGRRPAPRRDPIDLRALAHEAYRLFEKDYEESASGAVQFDDGDAEPDAFLACGDELLTLRVLWNLFGNDVKYAAPEGKVFVRFRRDGAFTCVDFEDEGPGMSEYEMAHAFDRYYRAKTVMESGKGGFGLGLCTARDAVRAMGGSLTVCARAPKGCVFTLALPN